MKITYGFLILFYAFGYSLVYGQKNTASEIRINQIGFLTSGQKQAAVVSPSTKVFELRDDFDKVVYKGNLLPGKYWDKSGEEVAIADFSGFKNAGKFIIRVGDTESRTFIIDERPFHELIKSATKYFYFHRASTVLEEKYSGVYKRPYAHPDTSVIVHPSGASMLRPTGYKLSAPFGWYDAGDYNKYMVNSGITTYTLLMSYLHNAELFDSLKLNIPESTNTKPDILDEILWNIRWMESMQDPDDGGVYHKTTTANFEKFVDPTKALSQRYVVAKGTAATLNFAAVMARAGMIFKSIDPDLSSRLIDRSKKAWVWANKHPNVIYQNPKESVDGPAIKTGEYGDKKLEDEFFWAGIELFLATGDQDYLSKVDLNEIEFGVPSWGSVETLGLISLLTHGANVPESLRKSASDKLMKLSKSLIEIWREAPYKVALNHFRWGSNAVVLNQGMVLINAYKIYGNTDFFEAALSGLDYVLGRNAVGYCFVTGMGHHSPTKPHHRISVSDGIDEPIPGMLVGGPNPHNMEQDCGKEKYGETLFPAKCYIDEVCSYSTNEVAINWNAPLVYVSSSLQTIYQKELSEN